jgi:hypothetical protein
MQTSLLKTTAYSYSNINTFIQILFKQKFQTEYNILCTEFCNYCHVYGWPIRRGLNWIYWSLLAQSLLITVTYNNSQEIFSWTLFPWLPRTHSLLLAELLEQSTAEQSSSLLPVTGQHGHSWHRAPLGPRAIYLFNVKAFVFPFFRCSSFDKQGGLGLFFIIGVPLLHLIPPRVGPHSKHVHCLVMDA